MIVGIGIDIQAMEKLEQSLQRSAFIRRVFTPAEIEICQQKRYPSQHFTGKFAAKEAFMKAIGAGIQQGVWFQQIEVLNHEHGAPFLRLYREAKLRAEQLAVAQIHLSLSHSAGIAVGVVILEG